MHIYILLIPKDIIYNLTLCYTSRWCLDIFQGTSKSTDPNLNSSSLSLNCFFLFWSLRNYTTFFFHKHFLLVCISCPGGFIVIFFIIHMCIQCLGHFPPLTTILCKRTLTGFCLPILWFTGSSLNDFWNISFFHFHCYEHHLHCHCYYTNLITSFLFCLLWLLAVDS
jgi:hypothetical protein